MKKGFTLIELLVVIAIIGILATISIINFGNIQAKSRDSQRKSDLSKIAAAMELYKTDKKLYPNTVVAGHTTWQKVDDFATVLTAGNYLATVPKNPKGSQSYAIISNGKTYKIVVTSETVILSDSETEKRRLAGDYYDGLNSSCLQVSPDNVGYKFGRPSDENVDLGGVTYCQTF